MSPRMDGLVMTVTGTGLNPGSAALDGEPQIILDSENFSSFFRCWSLHMLLVFGVFTFFF